MDPKLDFANEPRSLRQMVFYFSVPIFLINCLFFLFLIIYTLLHLRKLHRTSTLTKF